MTKVGELFVDVSADTSKVKAQIEDGITEPLEDAEESVKDFEKTASQAFNKAGDALKQFGSKATSAGKNLSLKLTAPVVALGGAAVKMSADFDKSMAMIVGLVGVGADEVAAWEDQVVSLASTYGKSATEAADALFFITSAGLRGADATSTLEASLKASAIGLGDVTQIADLATSAMNAYGASTLPASTATDVLVAAVREGKLEASELAGSMGSVLPIASAMGVSFNEVGATFASLSRTGTGASEAATQLRGILSSLLKPTADAEKQLKELGLSSDDLRTQIGTEGLFATLKTLTTAFGDNEVAQARVFGNVRALAGVMDLMGSNVAGTEAIFKAMADTTDATSNAFAVMEETAGFKMQQAFAQTKNALMEFGDIMMPVVASIASMISGLANRFSELDDGTKKIIIAVGGLLALLGPGLLIVGKFASMFGTLFKAISFTIQVTNALKGATVASTAAQKTAAIVQGAWTKVVWLFNAAWAANPIGFVIAAIAAFIAIVVVAYKKFDWFRVGVNKIINFIIAGFEMWVNSWVKAVNFITGGINTMTGWLGKIGINIGKIGELSEVSLGRLSTSTEKATDATGDFTNAGQNAAESAQGLAGALDLAALGLAGAGGTGTGGVAGSADKATKATDKMAEAVKKLRSEFGKNFETVLKAGTDALKKAKEEFQSFASDVAGAVNSVLSFKDGLKTAEDSNKTLTDALAKQADAQERLNEARNAGDLTAYTKAEKDLAAATAEVAKAQEKPMTFFDALNDQAARTRTFGELVNRLLQEGLSEQALQQVLDAGVDAGSAIARELLSSSENILRANTLVQEMDDVATRIGTNAAGKFRQAGVDTAQALVDGINSVIKNYSVRLSSKGLSAKQLKKLQKQFKVDVEFVMGGGVVELANGAVVNRRTPAIIGEAGPEAVIPISRPGRALQLMEQTGLASLARGGSSTAVNIENATFVAPIDAELVAQKVLVAERTRSL